MTGVLRSRLVAAIVIAVSLSLGILAAGCGPKADDAAKPPAAGGPETTSTTAEPGPGSP